MQKHESFNRGEKLGFELRMLPAETYNIMHLLLSYSDSSCVFLPIRSMQYMAVIDHEEVIFVDAISARRSIELSWQHFNPRERSSLTEPVPFRFVYYDSKALETMKRLQWEFDKALHVYYDRSKEKLPTTAATVIPLDLDQTDK